MYGRNVRATVQEAHVKVLTMGIWSQEIFEIICDAPGCCKGSQEGRGEYPTTEAQAIHQAEQDGFKKIGDLWYCPDCATDGRESS